MMGPTPNAARSGQHEALSRHGLLARARHRHARHAAGEGGRRRDDLVAQQAEWLRESVRAGRWRAAGFGGRGGAAAGPARARVAAARRAAQPAAPAAVAVVRSGAPQGAGGWGTIEVFETYNTVAPAVTLTCEDYGLVYRLAENNQKPMVRLDLDATLLGEQPAFNTDRHDQGHARSRTST